jgi:hypothetical protein
MVGKTAFDAFAPAILQVYHRNKEAFWEAVSAPFLANQVSFLAWLRHMRVDVGLLSAFKGLDGQARRLLKDWGAPLGLDITKWKSNRPQYFKDAYPVFAFLAVWMDEQGLEELLSSFGEILQAGVYAVAGYGILDENVDRDAPSSVEILTAQSLIGEYETSALRIFGVSRANLDIVQRMRTLFLEAEIREKSMRHIASPYRLDSPKELGAKGANSVTPLMLSLERLGKASLIDQYWEVFLLFGAAIQMIDDWSDLESDLVNGHYSYVTLGSDIPHRLKDPQEAARLLRDDTKRVRDTYTRSKEMIAQSRMILNRLDDPCLVRLVDVTEARLDSFFQKEMNMG